MAAELGEQTAQLTAEFHLTVLQASGSELLRAMA
jgi:DNA-binding FadR family transcriptional regulator